MRSKFSSKCRTCGQPIHRGEHIYWSPSEGGHHLACRRASTKTNSDLTLEPQHESVKSADLLDWVIVLVPLGLGSALVLMDAESAFIDFLVIPYIAAILNGGFKSTGGFQRVKWSHRKQMKFDLSFDMINAMAVLSIIPGVILWVVLKFLK